MQQKNQRTQGKKQKKKVPEHAERFMQAFSQIVYFSYRKDFPRLNYFNSTTDVGMYISHFNICAMSFCLIYLTLGWGCMLRTGQMMLARALMLAESGTSASVRGGPYALERKVSYCICDNEHNPNNAVTRSNRYYACSPIIQTQSIHIVFTTS